MVSKSHHHLFKIYRIIHTNGDICDTHPLRWLMESGLRNSSENNNHLLVDY